MKRRSRSITPFLIGSLLLGSVTACEDMPGTRSEQGAVIGGVGGAVAGAVIAGEGNRVLGALIGGAVGAAGGYVIGAESQKVRDREKDHAINASEHARTNPATAADVRNASTADLNNDGFVTLDEVVAMKGAGLSDDQMIERLRATNQIFDLNANQERYLTDRGVSRSVIDQLRAMNRDEKEKVLNDTIGRKRDSND
ncbi:MAG: glycine zipper 2TM domain-containing protein [Planctomycetes bacterium]|nr:glycine zipper 2TM domain-containing protein [Planctomycetota bacterium]MBI3844819.1 glycine zipper 2TM domain-containing protein [Planctomycetota bacterium]